MQVRRSLGALEERQFRLLFLGQATTALGNRMSMLALAFGVLAIIAGIKSMGLKNGGGRILGIILGSLGALFWLIGLLGSLSGQERFDAETLEFVETGPQLGGIVLALIMLGAYVAIVVLLAKNGRAFNRSAA